jgi:hypothetical protein
MVDRQPVCYLTDNVCNQIFKQATGLSLVNIATEKTAI